MATFFKHWKSYQFNRNVLRIEGTIAIAAGGAISATSIKGCTASKTGTGEYTITLDKKYKGNICCQVSLLSGTDVDAFLQIDSIDVVSAKTVVIKTIEAASVANLTNAGTIQFSISVQQ